MHMDNILRYQVKPILPKENPTRFLVIDTQHKLPNGLIVNRHVSAFVPESEANVIAFALNGVAEDRNLDASKKGIGGAFDNKRYDGPTEGINEHK